MVCFLMKKLVEVISAKFKIYFGEFMCTAPLTETHYYHFKRPRDFKFHVDRAFNRDSLLPLQKDHVTFKFHVHRTFNRDSLLPLRKTTWHSSFMWTAPLTETHYYHYKGPRDFKIYVGEFMWTAFNRDSLLPLQKTTWL